MEVVPVAEARAGLSRTLADFRLNPDARVQYIGSHRRPEAALVPIDAYRRLVENEAPSISMTRLRALRRVIERLAEASGLSEVRVFGSVARGEQTERSDVDLLVTPSAQTTLFDVARFELDMEELLGVPVSAVSDRALDPAVDELILREAVAL